jgi:biopolymer transport protein ExbD
MARKRLTGKLLVEPAAVATGDIAFNLIVFFLVCASAQPDSGRKQDLPRSEQTQQQEQKSQNIEMVLTRNTATVNGSPVTIEQLPQTLAQAFKGKTRIEDRVVVVKSRPDTPYHLWIEATSIVQDLGGIITIQREEERTVTVGN